MGHQLQYRNPGGQGLEVYWAGGECGGYGAELVGAGGGVGRIGLGSECSWWYKGLRRSCVDATDAAALLIFVGN